MSSRSANEILLEQECDRLKAEIDRHVRIYELALKEQAKELERWRRGGVTEEMLRKHDGAILVGTGCEIALAGTTKQAAADAELLDCRTIRLMTHNEATGAWEPMVFEDVDLREAIDDARKGGANG